MAKKINMSAVKEYLFNHGEKVALGTCAFVAVVLAALGLWSALSAGNNDKGKPWDKAFELEKSRLITQRQGVEPEQVDPVIEAKLNHKFYDWIDYESKFQSTPYVFFANDPGSKRLNPPALAINQEGIHVDFVRGLAYVHEIQQGKEVRTLEGAAGGGAGGNPKPGGIGPMPGGPAGMGAAASDLPLMMRKAEPVRMVVVTAVFPMKKQVEEFQRALKMLTQDDMFVKNRDDLPKPLGINVVRYELVDNQWKNEAIILMWDGSKVVMQQPKSSLDDVLKIAIYDEDMPRVLAPYLFEGLVTPMPRLGNAHYPRFNIPGMNIAWEDLDKGEGGGIGGIGGMGGGPPPMPKGGAGGPPPMPKGGAGGPPPMPGGSGLPGLKDKNKKDKAGGNPEAPANEPVAAKKEGPPLKSAELKEKDRQLWDRLFGKPHKYNVYHILGRFQDKEKAAEGAPGGMGAAKDDGQYFSAWDIDPPAFGAGGGAAPGGAPPPPGGFPPKKGSGGPPPVGGKGPMGMPPPKGDGGAGHGAVSPDWQRDAIVRFVDPGVLPGKTYKYAVQVRLANPNFNKNLEVVAGFMALVRELASEWRYTPQITIPGEYHLYALDQHLLDMWAKNQVKMDAKEVKEFKLDKNQTTFQIHQWTNRARDTMNNADPLLVGDWAIAERVAVYRGEEIGVQTITQVPIWKKEKDIFEMPTHQHLEKIIGTKAKTSTKQGLRIDFESTNRPYLVDFTGGKRAKVGTAVEEDTALEAIILMPDGKLKVLNSRADADHTQEIDEQDGSHVTRQERVQAARRAVENVIRGAAPTGPPSSPKDSPKLPGEKSDKEKRQ